MHVYIIHAIYINNAQIVNKDYKWIYNFYNISHEYLNVDLSSNLSFLRKVFPKPVNARSLAAARTEFDPTPE